MLPTKPVKHKICNKRKSHLSGQRYLKAVPGRTNDKNWNFKRPLPSMPLAPTLASRPRPFRKKTTIEGLIDIGISLISSMSSQRKVNLVLIPKRLE